MKNVYFKDLWSDFNNEIMLNHYQKVPYETYRRYIKPYLDNNSIVNIALSGNDCVVESGLFAETYWNCSDQSFGQYLYELRFPKSFDIATGALTYQDGLSSFEPSITYGTTSISNQINDICKIYIEDNYNTINIKEKNSMSNKIINFDFGPCKDNNIRMSMYGLAVMSPNGNWVSFDSKTNSVVDVDIINFEGKNFFYKVPVAIKDIKVGDTIVHNRKAMFVKEVAEGATSIVAVDAASAEIKTILPIRSIFNFDFYTKIISIMDFCGGINASVDTPFGNMLPMLMLTGDTNIDDILPMLMLTNGNEDFKSNPMMLYFLAKSGNMSNDNLLPLLFLMNNK